LWICVARLTDDPGLILPYTAAYTVHFALLGWTLSLLRNPAQNAWKRGPVLLVECWALMFAPYVSIAGVSREAVVRAIVALPVCGLGFALFCIIERRRKGLYSDSGWRWLREAALVLVTTAPLALMRGTP
jgi:hypothetical protein